VDQVARMDAATFFHRLCALMEHNPPAPADAPALRRFAALGLAPRGDWELGALPSGLQSALQRSVAEAQTRIQASARAVNPRMQVNGWHMDREAGSYGTDYARRAEVALMGLGANLAADATYGFARVDSEGEPLHGENRYVLHFEPGQLPPVNAFWSVTLYDDHQFFCANPLERYALGDRDPLRSNPDGSVDLLVQHATPRQSAQDNWLPAPAAPFNLILRMYWPRPELLDGRWEPPPVRRLQ
jgi:hypothetical protein